jgi:hypothetical protein
VASIAELRTGIATNLATISGLRTGSTIPDNVNPPFAIIAPASVDYHKAFSQRPVNLQLHGHFGCWSRV